MFRFNPFKKVDSVMGNSEEAQPKTNIEAVADTIKNMDYSSWDNVVQRYEEYMSRSASGQSLSNEEAADAMEIQFLFSEQTAKIDEQYNFGFPQRKKQLEKDYSEVA